MPHDTSRIWPWGTMAVAGAAVCAITVLFIGQGVPLASPDAAAPAVQQVVPDLLDRPVTPSPRSLNALQLAVTRAGDRLVSVGAGGVILLSDDGGRSWRQPQKVPVSVTLTDVAFASATLGWAVGHSGIILQSTDGGETWAVQLDGNGAARLVVEEAERLAADNAPNADAAKRNGDYLVADGPDKPFLAVHFADADHGWAVGAYGLAVATENGGATWRSISGHMQNPMGNHLYRIEQAGDQVMIAGEQGALLRSDDGGQTFTMVETPYEGTFFGALAQADGGFLVYGLKGNAWRSNGDMTDWQAVDLEQPVSVTAGLRLQDGSTVLGDEGGRLVRSTDGGRTFRTIGTPVGGGLTGLSQASDGALIVSGARGNDRIELTSLSMEDR